jgi:hypothetical protein
MQLKLELFFRFTAFFWALTIPLLINVLIMPNGFNAWKGVIGFGLTAVIVISLLVRQKHRISHISG